MFTFRNLLAVAVFLFGTTYLWLTPSFLSGARSAKGGVWMTVQVLALIAIVGFALAAWGIFKATSWWEPIAIAAALAGMASVIPYWIGVQDVAGVLRLEAVENAAIHFLGGAVVVAALLIHPAEQWIVGRL